jgi:hypothetical protein
MEIAMQRVARVLICAGFATCAAPLANATDQDAFAGTWVIKSSTAAPWANKERVPEPDEPKRLIGKKVAFQAKRVVGPSPIGCTKPVYKVETVGPDMLFEGMLAEPAQGSAPVDARPAAQKLGFADPAHIRTLDAGCTELQFHEVRDGVLAFGLNNRVYLMERRKE